VPQTLGSHPSASRLPNHRVITVDDIHEFVHNPHAMLPSAP
jgi:hypothetical protein